MQPCLDEATILAFGQGSVDAATKKRVEDHIGECEECRSLVRQVVRSSSIIPAAAPRPEGTKAPPDSEPPPAREAGARSEPAAPLPETRDPSTIQAAPSIVPPAGVNRVVVALAALILLIGVGAALSLALHR